MYRSICIIVTNFLWVSGILITESLQIQASEGRNFQGWGKSFILSLSFLTDRKRIIIPTGGKYHDDKAKQCLKKPSMGLVQCGSANGNLYYIKKKLFLSASRAENRNAFWDGVISQRSSDQGENEKNEEKCILFIKCSLLLLKIFPALWMCYSVFILSSFSFKLTVFILIHTAF